MSGDHEWNVRQSVVSVTTAPTSADAARVVRRALVDAGFEPYDDTADPLAVFHSETCPCGGEPT